MKLKSLFKKLFGGLNLVLLLVVVLGFAGNLVPEMKVSAEPKQLYLFEVANGSLPTKASACDKLSNTEYLCGTIEVGALFKAVYYFIPNCTSVSCSEGGSNYTECSPLKTNWSQGDQFYCPTVTSSNGGTTKVFQSNGITCTLASQAAIDKNKINKISLSNCTDKNSAKVIDPVDCIGHVNKDNMLGFSCNKQAVVFGDPNSTTGTSLGSVYNWTADGGGRVFKTADGGSIYIEDSLKVFSTSPLGNALDRICTGFDTIYGRIALGPFSAAFALGQTTNNNANNVYGCSKLKDFTEFKAKMKEEVTGAQTNLIDSIVQGPDLAVTDSKITDRGTCETLTAKQIEELRKKTDEKSKKQVQQIDKLKASGAWDGTSDLQLCASGALVCTNKKDAPVGTTICIDPELKTADYGSQGGIVTNAAAVKSKDDGIIDFIIKITAIALALVLYILTMVGLVVLFFFGILVLYLLDINPASLSFVEVAQKPWGLLASVGNILVLGAFMYVGFGYMMGIANMKKNLGDFLLKIIFYALLLNFTLLGAATIVNIGYGMGNLIKYAYANSTSKQDVNNQLMGNIIGPIGKISYLRCPNQESPECNFKIASDTNVLGQAAGNSGITGITSLWKDSNTAIGGAVAEGVTLIMILFALYVFWKALYTVFYRVVATWMLMILSPIALASYFSPVDEWKSIGKDMFSQFWKLVLFYPCFIFALVLVNTMSGAFSGAARAASGASTPTTGSAINAGTGIGTGFSVSVFAENVTTNPAAAFQNLTLTVLGAGVAMMGLWAVTKYFSDSFEADMGKIGGGIKGAYDGAKTGFTKSWGIAKGGFHAAGGVGRGGAWGLKNTIGKLPLGGGKNLNDITGEVGKTLGKNRIFGAVGRTAGNFLTGRTLHDIENKAGSAKKLWDGLSNIEKKELAGQKITDEIKNSVLLRRMGMANLLDNSGSDPARGLNSEVLNGEDGQKLINDLITSQDAQARGSIIGDVKNIPKDIVEAKLRSMVDKNGDLNINDDILSDLFEQAVKTNHTTALQMIVSQPEMLNKVRGFVGESRYDDDIQKTISTQYGAFLKDEKTIGFNARGDAANKNYTPSVIEMMDETYHKEYLEQIEKQIESGEKDALERKSRYLATRGGQLGNAAKRAYDNLYKNVGGYNKDTDADDFYNRENLHGVGTFNKTPHSPSKAKLETNDYVTAAAAIANNANHQNIHDMDESQFNSLVQSHGLEGIASKGGESFTNRKAVVANAFKVGKVVHDSNQTTGGLTRQKQIYNDILAGNVTADHELQIGVEKGLDSIMQQALVDQARQSYQNSAEMQEDVAKIREKNANVTIREAQKMAVESRENYAKQSAERIKSMMADGLKSGNVTASRDQIDKEMSKFFDQQDQAHIDFMTNAVNTMNKSGGWTAQVQTSGRAEIARMQGQQGGIQGQIDNINAEIRQKQEQAIIENNKLKETN